MNYLTFDDILNASICVILGHFYESTLFRTAGEIADQSKHISHADRAPAENTFGHTHTCVHRNDLIGVAASFWRFCWSCHVPISAWALIFNRESAKMSLSGFQSFLRREWKNFLNDQSIYKPSFSKKCGHLFCRIASASVLLIGWAMIFFATQVRGCIPDLPHWPYQAQ